MHGRLFIVGAICCSALFAQAQDNAGLVLYYTFDEAAAGTVQDHSGNGITGTIHGAVLAPQGKGNCLEFDGVDDYVDCGDVPALDLKDAITLEAWVYPENRVTGEPGILGKHFDAYQLTYYADGKCWWYISGGGNNAKGLLTSGSWHHIAGTFDGQTLALYIDGKQVDARPSQFPQINSLYHFYIGCVPSDPSAEPSATRTAYFPGKIDEVRIYNRALNADEVRVQFEDGVKGLIVAAAYAPGQAVMEIARGPLQARADANGQIQIGTGAKTYLLDSAWSFAGERIGWNRFGEDAAKSEPDWKITTARESASSLVVTGRSGRYAIERRLAIREDRIDVADTLTSLSDAPIGFIARHALTSPEPFATAFTPGGAENPTLFLKNSGDSLGLVMQDSLSRIRFEPNLGLPANQAKFSLANIALAPRDSRQLRWTIYPLPREAEYFDFVNRIRRDWTTNFTIPGPFSFFDLGSPLLQQPDQLKAYLQRRRIKLVGLSPWLDYDPGAFDRVWPREEYKARIQEAARAIKAADPSALCLGCIETDWIAFDPAKIPNGDKLPVHGSGSGVLTPEFTKIIDDANLTWKDSMKRSADGTLTLELYSRGGKPQTSLSVYPRVGNYQYTFLMDQVKFLINEVGLDGFYIDEFSQGWRGGIASYDGWDGISAEIDPRTGEIRRTYTDCSLAGIQARINLCRYALDRGKVVVANTYATAEEEQAFPVMRFSETQASFDPMASQNNAMPRGVADVFRGNLATPIGLGIIGAPAKHDTAQRVMKAVIAYLRHGALYYHYAIEDIPESGEGSGEYGPINHMFPITPLELHEGWIEGEERIITAVSRDFLWKSPQPPHLLRFDTNGREIPQAWTITQDGDKWHVSVKLEDWAEIGIIE